MTEKAPGLMQKHWLFRLWHLQMRMAVILPLVLEDKGDVTGIDGYEENLNELLRVPFDYCVPTVNVDTEMMDCIDVKGNPNHILIMYVMQSNQLHANQADEVYYRIGDKSKKMNFEQRTRLMYAKGPRFFEDAPVRDATIDNIDLDFVQSYIKKIGYGREPLEYLRGNPKIFEFLHEYDYVKEFGEGVDRMYREMNDAGLPEPEYRTVEFMVFATLKNHKWVENQRAVVEGEQVADQVTEQVTEQVADQVEKIMQQQ
ncbi:MAG: hypothetical protein LUG27_01800, partial [Clostridiales bacterium]|nr:hypothetical protein [Clostridiales bacterium]